ncbi:MAG: hypothetical protein Q8R92_19850, partial [Deltaproteobacteria bacterium]|nr:hypothetical protein [Deltaproteobacteria bacterium]
AASWVFSLLCSQGADPADPSSAGANSLSEGEFRESPDARGKDPSWATDGLMAPNSRTNDTFQIVLMPHILSPRRDSKRQPFVNAEIPRTPKLHLHCAA